MIPRSLKFADSHLKLYTAGQPTFARNFSRDSFYSGLICDDIKLLTDQLYFSARLQSTTKNHITGGEPGKIHHEYPEVIIKGKSTLFAACDTTSLFLVAAGKIAKKNPEAIKNLKPHAELALKYLFSHIKDGIFWEDPSHCGADEFALKVTYWKDSSLSKRVDGKPLYPVAYLVNQAITIQALRCAQQILQQDLSQHITSAVNGLHSFFNPHTKQWCIAKDAAGEIVENNSDILHALYFLQPGDVDKIQLKAVQNVAKVLQTPWGYRTSDPILCTLETKYHSCSLWPFEQAVIHAGLLRFNLQDEAKIASKIMHIIDGNKKAWELFYVFDNQISPAGCNPQLWTCACWKYFNNLQKQNSSGDKKI